MTYRARRPPRRAGRKPLSSTLYLARRLAEGADPRALCDEWERVYEQTYGWRHADIWHSYRAALKNAKKYKGGMEK